MKKLVLFLILLIPTFVMAQGDIYISDVTLKDSNGKAIQVSEPVFSDDNIDFNIRFEDINDEINYVITVKNSSNKDYKIELEEDFLNSDYFSYEYKFDVDDSVIKANSTRVINIVIKYKKEVEEAKLTDGVFNEENHFQFSLVANVVNPNTKIFINSSIVIIALIGLIALIILVKDKKYIIGIYVVLVSVISIPLTINALETFKISVNTTIEVNKAGYFYVYHSSDNSVDKFYMSDYKDKTLDLTSLVKDNFLYAGYYHDYAFKGSYQGDGVEVDDGTPYRGELRAWGDDYYTESGLTLTPERGTTYYLKELHDGYLRHYNEVIYNIHSNFISNLLFFSSVDDTHFKKQGAVMNDVRYEVDLKLLYHFSTGTTLIAKNMFEQFGVERGYIIAVVEYPTLEENQTIKEVPFYVTMDNVYVEGFYYREIYTGNLIMDDGFRTSNDIVNEDRLVVDYDTLS